MRRTEDSALEALNPAYLRSVHPHIVMLPKFPSGGDQDVWIMRGGGSVFLMNSENSVQVSLSTPLSDEEAMAIIRHNEAHGHTFYPRERKIQSGWNIKGMVAQTDKEISRLELKGHPRRKV